MRMVCKTHLSVTSADVSRPLEIRGHLQKASFGGDLRVVVEENTFVALCVLLDVNHLHYRKDIRTLKSLHFPYVRSAKIIAEFEERSVDLEREREEGGASPRHNVNISDRQGKRRT
ncbi:hypothetical protein CEXT_72601 [Caerostris extrusa]|uniref:Uncharacterized protein n=1 Tax=Caerostris extrusa TaxID=172846 RepID=A0AAV4R9R8_CAEEX|nr:hypothetical protein CEXT_72601 [Caerostris extrusa]